jgi:alpha-amylase
LKELARAVKAARPDAVLLGEAWSSTDDIAGYYDELDAMFDFPLASAVLEGVKAGRAAGIAAVIEEVARKYPRGAVDAPFLANHDQLRIANQLDEAGLRLAAAILLTLPGAAFVWQGEELGMRQADGGDDALKRTPMPWTGGPGAGFTTGTPWHPLAPGWEKTNVASESADASSLLSRYRALIRLRHESRALRTGDLTLVPTAPGVLAYVRRGGGESVLVVHNLGTEEVPLPMEVGEQLFGQAKGVPGRSSGVWRVR